MTETHLESAAGMTDARPRLIADVGGTNARFALAGADGAIDAALTLPVGGHKTFVAALATYLTTTGARPRAAAIAAAGPHDGDGVRLTNAAWTVRSAEITAALDGAPAAVFNDLEAVALALPYLAATDLDVLHDGQTPPTTPHAPMLAFNVGTGLGAAVAVPLGDGQWRALATEAGHMRFASVDAAEALMAPHVTTYEDVLSGRGFQLMQRLLPNAVDRRQVFSRLLGRVAGDLIVATGAWGGLYLCGGVLDDWDANVDVEAFREAFVDKGPMAGRMAALPVSRIVRPAPALLGLAHAPIPSDG